MFGTQPTHILFVLIALIVLFGAKRLPDSARSLGKSLRIFKSEMNEMKKDEIESKNESKKDETDGSSDK